MLPNDHLVSICHYKPYEEHQADWNPFQTLPKEKLQSLYFKPAIQLGQGGAVLLVFCVWKCDQCKGYDEQQERGLWICFIFLDYWCHYSYIINEWLLSATNHWRLFSPIVLNDINPQLWFGKQPGIKPHHLGPSGQRRTAGKWISELPNPGIYFMYASGVFFSDIKYFDIWDMFDWLLG